MKIESSEQILSRAISEFNPTHIVSMVSGGKDSAASDAVARELGARIKNGTKIIGGANDPTRPRQSARGSKAS